MFKFILIAILLLASRVAYCADENTIKEKIQAKFPDRKIENVTYGAHGLYEISSEGKIIYADATGRFLFIGSIVDLETKTNVTKKQLTKINTIDFSTLPVRDAIIIKNGNGSRKIALFTDPNCKFCKVTEKELKDLDNVTIYVYMYGVLSESSLEISRDVWCSSDKAGSWQQWMLEDIRPATASAGCVSPNSEVLKLGKRLNIKGTPSTFFADGSRVVGLLTRTAVEKKFDALKEYKSSR
ncbi:DsbC family protein [Pseudoduganella aquatica]|uniref:DsbC family protein n=1 Tax=Pseudoduganella aquatica TaxID=2660641 RepID=UPI001E31718B|nr:DsbC family protein [Pseudoduganella aquatica]